VRGPLQELLQASDCAVFHGTDDSLVPIGESEYAVAQLKAAGKIEGRDYVFKPVKGQGHGFTGLALTQSRDGAVAFFTQQL
jgi:dipeptidyl aminopeptidase/acylaminoacyl peptidase